MTDDDRGIVGTAGRDRRRGHDLAHLAACGSLGRGVLSEDGKSVGFDGDSGEGALDTCATRRRRVRLRRHIRRLRRMNQLFQNNKMAMTITGPWNLPDFVDAKVSYGVVELPAFQGEHATMRARMLGDLRQRREALEGGAGVRRLAHEP